MEVAERDAWRWAGVAGGGGREKAVLTDTKVSETGNQEIARKMLSPPSLP